MGRHASFDPLPAVATDRDRKTLAHSFDIEGLRLTKTAGLLVLEGQVPSYRTKKLAGIAAARLPGAARIVNRLRVVPQSHRRDGELAEAVQAALDACARLGSESIAVSVCHGIVTLQGSVSSPAIRCEAESAAWAVGGVVDVENRLQVECLPSNGHARRRTSLPATRR